MFTYNIRTYTCTYIYTYICKHVQNLQVISNQCEKRNTRIQKSVTFKITDGEELCISNIDLSRVNYNEWQIYKSGKLNVSNVLAVWL